MRTLTVLALAIYSAALADDPPRSLTRKVTLSRQIPSSSAGLALLV